ELVDENTIRISHYLALVGNNVLDLISLLPATQPQALAPAASPAPVTIAPAAPTVTWESPRFCIGRNSLRGQTPNSPRRNSNFKDFFRRIRSLSLHQPRRC